MKRAKRIQATSAAVALAGAFEAAHRVVVIEDGQSFGWRFFAGLAMAIVGAATLGSSLLHAACDREAIYRLGYTAGRIDAIRDLNRAADVIPLRPAPNGLHAFNRQAAASQRARRPRPERARAERADTHG